MAQTLRFGCKDQARRLSEGDLAGGFERHREGELVIVVAAVLQLRDHEGAGERAEARNDEIPRRDRAVDPVGEQRILGRRVLEHARTGDRDRLHACRGEQLAIAAGRRLVGDVDHRVVQVDGVGADATDGGLRSRNVDLKEDLATLLTSHLDLLGDSAPALIATVGLALAIAENVGLQLHEVHQPVRGHRRRPRAEQDFDCVNDRPRLLRALVFGPRPQLERHVLPEVRGCVPRLAGEFELEVGIGSPAARRCCDVVRHVAVNARPAKQRPSAPRPFACAWSARREFARCPAHMPAAFSRVSTSATIAGASSSAARPMNGRPPRSGGLNSSGAACAALTSISMCSSVSETKTSCGSWIDPISLPVSPAGYSPGAEAWCGGREP